LERLAVIARLKPGAEVRGEELIARGPPFDPKERGLARVSVYLSASEVMFVFEAHEVETIVEDLIDDPFQSMVEEAFDAWRPLVDGEPRIARAKFFWERDPEA
jgi:hypothetical protein